MYGLHVALHGMQYKRVKSGAGEWSTADAYGLDILYGPYLIKREPKPSEILVFFKTPWGLDLGVF